MEHSDMIQATCQEHESWCVECSVIGLLQITELWEVG